MVIRVLIVDDHCIVREGLRMLLACDPNLEVVVEASNMRKPSRTMQWSSTISTRITIAAHPFE